MKLTTKDMFYLALIGAGIFLAWKFWEKIKAATNAAGDTIAAPIADAITSITQPGDVEILGQIQLPNGALIPFDGLSIDSNLQFSYMGNRYRIDHREGDTYVAKNVIG